MGILIPDLVCINRLKTCPAHLCICQELQQIAVVVLNMGDCCSVCEDPGISQSWVKGWPQPGCARGSGDGLVTLGPESLRAS